MSEKMNTDKQEEKRKPGRPSKIGGKDRKVYLDDKTVEKCRQIGRGSLSEGIRIAAEKYDIEKEKTD